METQADPDRTTVYIRCVPFDEHHMETKSTSVLALMRVNTRVRECSDISEGYQCVDTDTLKHQRTHMPSDALKVSFYERITKDIAAFAEKYAKGKVVSVLEGGYSDLALISASMSHVAGFFPGARSRAQWWQKPTLEHVSKLCWSSYTSLTSYLPDRPCNSKIA